jgi:hypothetical protein
MTYTNSHSNSYQKPGYMQEQPQSYKAQAQSNPYKQNSYNNNSYNYNQQPAHN